MRGKIRNFPLNWITNALSYVWSAISPHLRLVSSPKLCVYHPLKAGVSILNRHTSISTLRPTNKCPYCRRNHESRPLKCYLCVPPRGGDTVCTQPQPHTQPSRLERKSFLLLQSVCRHMAVMIPRVQLLLHGVSGGYGPHLSLPSGHMGKPRP